MKEKLIEISDGLQQRLKSPFIVTFIIVWCIHNWRFLGYIFTFDETTTFAQKTGLLWSYADVLGYWHLLWLPLLLSFASMLSYYVLSLFAEAINIGYSKWARAFLYSKLDTNKIKTIQAYKELDKTKVALETMLREKREEVTAANLTIQELEKEVESFQVEINSLVSEKQGLSGTLSSLDKSTKDQMEEINSLKNELQNQTKEYETKLEKLKKDFNSETATTLLLEETEATKFKLWMQASHPDISFSWFSEKFKDSTKLEIERLIHAYRVFQSYFAVESVWDVKFIANEKIAYETTYTVGKNGSDLIFTDSKDILRLVTNIHIQGNSELQFDLIRLDEFDGQLPLDNKRNRYTLDMDANGNLRGNINGFFVLFNRLA